jgi:hypothetical protein
MWTFNALTTDNAMRKVIVVLLLCGQAICGLPMSAQAADEHEFPPVQPVSETTLPDDPSFVEECLSSLRNNPVAKGWEFGPSILTRSEKWGMVWRADVKIPDSDFAPQLVNRVICWRKSSDAKLNIQIAIGQKVPPLTRGKPL